MSKAKGSLAVSKSFTKSELLSTLAEETGLGKKDVAAVLDALAGIIGRHIKKRAVGQFTLPGLLKIKTIRKAATKARKGTNPFTSEETTFAAKPARTVVKVQPLKNLKDMTA